jgi:tetratricopeptide (TPR) repeat protein
MGLMCKPMLVTLPIVLLLLDYWPLNRFESTSDRSRTSLWRLLVEKIPLLLLSLISCIVTLSVQQQAMRSLQHLSLTWRLRNAIASYCIYIWQMLWPASLAVIYPYAENGPWTSGAILLGAAFLVIVTIGTVALRRRCPYLMTGWLWYLVMLVPVSGLVQVGMQAHADRYTYLSGIGLYIALTWTITDFLARHRFLNQLSRVGAVVVVGVLSWRASHQTSVWRDSESLWRHTLSVMPVNDVADNNLGNVLLHQGRADEAIVHYEKVLARRSGRRDIELKETYYNLGNALLQKGQLDDAIALYRKALEFTADYTADAHNNLGNALLRKGMVDEAVLHFRKVVEMPGGSEDDRARANYNLANALLQNGELDPAIAYYQKAIKLDPLFSDAYNNLGNALLRKGSADAAVPYLRKVLELCAGLKKSDQAKAHYNLGNALFAANHTDEAIEQYRAATALLPTYSEAHNNLANGLLKEGSIDEAIQHFQEVVRLRAAQGGASLAKAHYNLANAFFSKGQIDDAIAHHRKALELQPGYTDAHINLGNALHHKRGMDREAIAEYEEALRIDHHSALALSQIAWLLATSSEEALRNGARAVEFAEKADQLSGGGNAIVLHALAAAYAENGEFFKATESARRALTLATAQESTNLANALQREITSYQAGLPYRENQE